MSTYNASNVWAVGYSQDANGIHHSIIEHWDGASWAVQTTDDPGAHGNSLYGVKAFSATNIWAVGTYVDANDSRYTLIEHTTDGGSTWAQDTSYPGDGILYAIDGDPASGDAWAVGVDGSTNHPLTLHLSGGSWSSVSTSADASSQIFLYGVSEDTSDHVWVVGNYYNSGDHPFSMYYDGSWSTKINTNSGYINGVVNLGSSGAWAVGYDGTNSYLTQWDGSVWSSATTLSLGSSSNLTSVAALDSTNLWAVGYYYNSGTYPLVYHSSDDGSTWQQVPAENPGGPAIFNSLAIDKDTGNIWAVGYYGQSNTTKTLTEQYTPGQPLPTGTWITPNDSFSVQAGITLQLSANAYPAQANSSIQHVDFAANWNGSWQTVCTTTSSSNTFGCYWNLTDVNGVPIPNGGLQIEFTIYDSSGISTLSPILQGTITSPQVQQQTSNHWAGYYVTGKQYADVKGSWVQPQISCGKKETSYAGFWVGLDGAPSNTVEQIGTAGTCQNGKAYYYVWYQMYPDKEVKIFTGLQPGNQAQAEVSYQGNDKFKLSITISNGVNTWTNPPTVLTRKGAARNSAEWIAEAPFLKNGTNPWPQFGTVTFIGCSAGRISIASGPAVSEDTVIYGLFNSPKGQPSSLNSNNTGFSVQWVHA